nr:hypothetical protein [Halopolyspora algeriensis]
METLATVLAQPDFPGGEPSGGQGEGFGKSTPLGLFLLLALFIAVAFLARSMTTHLKRVPTRFDQDRAAAAAPARVKRAEAARAAQAAENAEQGEGSEDNAAGEDDAAAAEGDGSDPVSRPGGGQETT